MSKLVLVFADCFACGMRKEWAEHQLAEAQANKFEVEKLPFYADGAADYIRLAIAQGVNMPFFSDGKKVSRDVADFFEKAEKKASKKAAKRRVKKAEAEDEV